MVPVAAFYGSDAVTNYFAKLGVDRSPLVRARFVEMIGGWMLNLPDRVDHEVRAPLLTCWRIARSVHVVTLHRPANRAASCRTW